MLYPSIFSENLFDDLMDFSFPTFRDFNFDDVDRKLYGKHAARLMKTDVHEHITLTLEKGNLTVAATKGLDKDEKNKKGRVIRQERYSGSMQRSFFVGHNVTEDEIKAKFEDGVLKLTVPKKEAAKVPEKKTIAIEG